MADAEKIFRSTLTAVAKEHNYQNYNVTITPFSTGGANYITHLFLAKIRGSQDVDVFGKVAACGEKMRVQLPVKFYCNECYFYNTLSKVYQDLEDMSNVTEEKKLKLPKFYGCNANLYEETIILEDLGSRGFRTQDRMKSFDWEYASAAVSQLARFHALSLAYMTKNKEAFDDDVENFVGNWDHVIEDWESIRKKTIKPALDSVSEENKDKLKRYIEKNFGINPYLELVGANKIEVILHGDYRPSNLMHRTLEDGKIELIPVDFQTLQGGSPIIDLLYFIYTGSDEEFRRLHFQRLVDHYYVELSAAMDRLGVDPGIYSRKDFDDDLQQKISYGLFVAIFVLPAVTVEAENAPKINEDTDLLSFSVQQASNLYTERLNGIVDEYVRLGILT